MRFPLWILLSFLFSLEVFSFQVQVPETIIIFIEKLKDESIQFTGSIVEYIEISREQSGSILMM